MKKMSCLKRLAYRLTVRRVVYLHWSECYPSNKEKFKLRNWIFGSLNELKYKLKRRGA